MAAPTKPAYVKKALANLEPSTHGTKPTVELRQSKSALPGYLRRQLALLSKAHRRAQCQDTGRCFRFWCGPTGAERLVGFRFGGRSTPGEDRLRKNEAPR